MKRDEESESRLRELQAECDRALSELEELQQSIGEATDLPNAVQLKYANAKRRYDEARQRLDEFRRSGADPG